MEHTCAAAVEHTCTAAVEHTCAAAVEQTCAAAEEHTCATAVEHTCATAVEHTCAAAVEHTCAAAVAVVIRQSTLKSREVFEGDVWERSLLASDSNSTNSFILSFTKDEIKKRDRWSDLHK